MAAKRWYVPSPEQEAMAAELVELRKARKISQGDAAKAVGLGAPQISEIETATRPIAEDTLLALLRFLGAEPATAARLNRLRAVDIDTKSEWFADYAWPSDKLRYVMRAEARAEKIYTAQEQSLPGLLQTPGYATELLQNLGNTGTRLQEAVEIRTERQRAFFKHTRHSTRFFAVISESLLRKGSREVLGEQLGRILKMQRDGQIECRVLPETALVAVLGFTLMDFSSGRSIGYASGGLDTLDVVRMRDAERLADLRDRYGVYSGIALTPDESASLIEKYQKGI